MKVENIEHRTSNTERRTDDVRAVFDEFVVPSYGRFELVLERGQGSYVWDANGKRYLDLGGGIAVNALGHAHSEIADVLGAQARKLVHISNLYYNELQGRLAERLVRLIGPGRVFFCNSGAEANEGLYKLARKFGAARGRFEVITTTDSFHGRTLAGIAATGQEKVKQGFDPAVSGFSHVPFNDLEAMRAAVTDKTAAILIEPVQGESGITVATSDYLLGLRQLCDERELLLMFDEVQAGHFRTGKFHSWQRILGGTNFQPDAISMAKALGNGFPMGAFWVREKFGEVLSAGSHASTFGGTPLACAVGLKVLEIIERDGLGENADSLGEFLVGGLRSMAEKFPSVVHSVRGLGLMIGIEFQPEFKAPDVVKRLHERGVLTVPAKTSVIRLLPPLNLSRAEAEEGLAAIEAVVEALNR